MADKGKLTGEDRILWGKVARSTRALPGRMELLAALEEKIAETVPAIPLPKKPSPKEEGTIRTQPTPDTPRRHHPLEKPIKRKLARGHLTIDARIDLHGMAQSQAHGFLLHFMLTAHGRGLRHVLVITGKGSSMGSDGALRRAVPLWFSLPDFRSLISSYEPAARNHGGEGALYVRLSRPKGANHP